MDGSRLEDGIVMTATATYSLRGPVNEERNLTIRLEQGHSNIPACQDLPNSEYRNTFYTSPKHALSVAVLPATGTEYETGCSVVTRQNSRFAANRGFRWEIIDRADWEEDLFLIRSSQPVRQGREMPEAYMTRQTYRSDMWTEPHCRRHAITVHGVIGSDGRLAGYCQVVQCGEVFRVNSILGHWDKLPERVMWLLMVELTKWHIDECGAAYALYYTHLSGHGGGLRYWKERLGYRPSRVTWEF